ncbi:hypothetical protein IMG5_179390 [Ichthyophthirius multifiliis]|uniref:Transmembrane protein n=1 Tax=Ichthyophthirius multifiliis TaxID=5932 RepID=G0R2L8_ICHMU|nr:hypothetical protein IMG5_179390 [Ichthyophthirius multifiliis]EGR28282.1 hypothetical protein IMG5_179390 [Ichthyophthirius multifiliis]|eukprot:XP_004027627.1 hypothetical protein IMG5_179390 [Ichthyophthirius multifiliis]
MEYSYHNSMVLELNPLMPKDAYYYFPQFGKINVYQGFYMLIILNWIKLFKQQNNTKSGEKRQFRLNIMKLQNDNFQVEHFNYMEETIDFVQFLSQMRRKQILNLILRNYYNLQLIFLNLSLNF